MTQQSRFIRLPNGKLVPIPDSVSSTNTQPIEPVESETIEEQPKAEKQYEFPEAHLSAKAADSIFGIYEDDIIGGDGTFDSLVKVSKEDILGRPTPKKRRMRITTKGRNYQPPGESLGGIRM